eukprot:TRINITY_DN15100_c0_g1_i1.p1 TRINITY_DN15100_c0_g1~~TRINITY_DN15100_c0_g1_i1.p1  ORF type:complete len:181 (+),score=49.34 TRINITY_DN15100_c0_g1_i1:372-914(+)
MKGDIDIVKLLIHRGAPFDEPDQDGNTPLMIAVRRKQMDAVEELSFHKVDWKHVNKQGFSAQTYIDRDPELQILMQRWKDRDATDTKRMAKLKRIPLKEWTASDVQIWLGTLKIEHRDLDAIKQAFQTRKFTGRNLFHMDEAQLVIEFEILDVPLRYGLLRARDHMLEDQEKKTAKKDEL